MILDLQSIAKKINELKTAPEKTVDEIANEILQKKEFLKENNFDEDLLDIAKYENLSEFFINAKKLNKFIDTESSKIANAICTGELSWKEYKNRK